MHDKYRHANYFIVIPRTGINVTNLTPLIQTVCQLNHIFLENTYKLIKLCFVHGFHGN